jgi:hypothetical protein
MFITGVQMRRELRGWAVMCTLWKWDLYLKVWLHTVYGRSEMFGMVWSKLVFMWPTVFGRESSLSANSNMLEPDGPQHNCPADFVLSPDIILQQFLSHLAFVPTRKNVSFIFSSFPLQHEFKIFYLNFFFCIFKLAEVRNCMVREH